VRRKKGSDVAICTPIPYSNPVSFWLDAVLICLEYSLRECYIMNKHTIVRIFSSPCSIFAMSETQEQWYNRQAIEQLAQHIPFERDTASKAEQIEMLRGLVIRHGRSMDPELFGFEARNELIRLGLWSRIGPEQK
jgi:hypothetical protein